MYKAEEGAAFQHILYRKIMASLAGPVPIHLTGTPVNFSMYSTYFLAFSGKSWYELMFMLLLFHPGRVS
jgi:hypothetical protein